MKIMGFIEDNLQKQEDRYSEKLKRLIDICALNEDQQKRAEEELELIRLSGSSKYIYIAYQIARILRRDNQCFSVRGSAGDSLICYLLGITKVSPYDPRLPYTLPYQPFLGIREKPRNTDIEFNVPVDYHEKLYEEIRELMNEDTEFYETVRLRGNCPPRWLICSFKGFSETETFRKHCPEDGVLQNRYLDYRWYEQYHLIVIVITSVLPVEVNNIFRKTYDTRVDEEMAFRLLSQEQDEENFATNRDNSMARSGDYWLYCLGSSSAHNTTDEGVQKGLICREDIWQRLEKLKADETEKYQLYKLLYGGRAEELMLEELRLLEEAGETDFVDEMKSYQWILSIASEIEFVENHIELVWHKHNYPNLFDIIMESFAYN